MALNLISCYDSDSDSDISNSTPKSGEPEHTLEEGRTQFTENQKCSFFFGGDEGSSSDEEGDNRRTKSESPEKKPKSGVQRRLPSAGSVLKGKHVGSSVFSSEREQEDLVQQFTLSQHVPLTEKIDTKKKPLCRAFQRGECRRGNKCRFAHPTSPQTPKDAAVLAGAPKMYNADDVFAKKAKIV